MTKEELKSLFSRHTPTEDQVSVMNDVRNMTYKLAGTMLVNSPSGPEQTLAIRRLHEALMYFNLSLVIGNK